MAILSLAVIILILLIVSINYLRRPNNQGRTVSQDRMVSIGRAASKGSVSKDSARKDNTGKDRAPTVPRVYHQKKYRAVGVRPQLYCCRAVLALENIRFLAEQAPHFPVDGCNVNNCRCQYLYYPDRRDEERRSPFGAARNWSPSAAGGDRRRTRDRRIGAGATT